MGRRLSTHLDLLHPHSCEKAPVEKQSGHQRTRRVLQENDQAFARDYQGPNKWVPVQVVEVMGPLSYKVMTGDGRVWRRHIDQLRRDTSSTTSELSQPEKLNPNSSGEPEDWPIVTRSNGDQSSQLPSSSSIAPPGEPPPERSPILEPRRSSRVSKPVDRYGPMVPT